MWRKAQAESGVTVAQGFSPARNPIRVRPRIILALPNIMAIAPGTRIGPYDVLSLVGAGGMGEVYRARDSRLGRDVAIKVLPAGLNADADRLQRFEPEARAAAALNHPNILTVHENRQPRAGDRSYRPIRRLGAARRPDADSVFRICMC